MENKTEQEIILESKSSKHEKNYKLHLAGFKNDKIAELTGSSKANVARDIWGHKNDKFKKK